MSVTRRTDLGVLAAIAALVAAYWSPAWRAGPGGFDFPGHVALLATLSDQLREGHWLPLWTSDWNSGSSLIFWYIQPLFSSYLLLPFTQGFGLVEGIRIGDTFFIALAGMAMYGFGRALTGSPAAGFLGAIVYALHPSVASFVGEVGQIHQPIALAILPALLWAWLAFAREPTRRAGVFAAATAALLFYDMERFWLTAPHALLLYLVVATRVRAGHGWRKARAVVLPVFGVGLATALLVAFPTLPALFERPRLQWHDVETIDVFRRYYSFPHLFALMDRGGALAELLHGRIPREFVSLPGQWYQGVAALAFVAVGLLLERRAPRDVGGSVEPGLVLALWLLSLLTAFGVHAMGPKHASLVAALLDRAPGFGASVVLLAAAVLLVLFLALAIGACARWIAGDSTTWRWVALGAATLALLFAKPFVALAQTVFVYGHLRAPSHFAFPALPLLLATAVCLVTPHWLRLAGARRAPLVVGLFALVHLVDVHPYRFQTDWEIEPQRVAAWRDAFSQLESLPEGRVIDTHHYNPAADWMTATQTPRTMAWSWLSWTSTREIGDLIETGFYDTMRIARQRPTLSQPNAQTAAQLAGLANVRFVSRFEGTSPPMPPSTMFAPVVSGEGITIYRNERALPYLQFYPEVALLSGRLDETVPVVGALAQRGIASITIESDAAAPSFAVDFHHGAAARDRASAHARPIDQALARATSAPSKVAAPCRFENRKAERIALDCSFEQPGVLVVAEAWFPNWRVELDGRVSKAQRFNHAFLGTPVAAGTTKVTFAHHPSLATRISRPVSMLAWMGVLLFALLALRARWRRD